MSSYVNAILTGSEYCTANLDQHTDDYIVRRMIKCCSNLGCFMQAAVLCQVWILSDFTCKTKLIDCQFGFQFFIRFETVPRRNRL